MKIGQSGHRRSPLRCWAVAFFAAAAVMPGAAIHISADEGSNNPKPATAPGPVVHDWAADSQPEAHAPPPNMKYLVVYSVANILSKIREERGLSEPAAKDFLKERVKSPGVGSKYISGQLTGPYDPVWHDDNLVIKATRAEHEQVVKTLDAFRKFGTSTQIAIETRFFTLREDDHQKVFPDWTTAPLNVDEAALANSDAVQPASFDRPLGSRKDTYVARAQSLIEKNEPMCFRIMDQRQGEELLIDRCQQDKRTNVVQAPKVTVFNGQTAKAEATSVSWQKWLVEGNRQDRRETQELVLMLRAEKIDTLKPRRIE